MRVEKAGTLLKQISKECLRVTSANLQIRPHWGDGDLIEVTFSGVRFSISSFAAWAPGVDTREAWLEWSCGQRPIGGAAEPEVSEMAPMLRRRAGVLDRMALEVAYRCLGNRTGVPAIFCSRHGETSRSVDLLTDLAKGLPLSPTAFGLSVHNATGGLFSIARADHAVSSALAAGQSGVEHAVIEACGLLAEGAPEVLLVVYDRPLPALYAAYQDCHEQPFAWAWLMQPPASDIVSLSWSAVVDDQAASVERLSPGLAILRFYLRQDCSLERICQPRRWLWSRDA